MPLRIFRDPPVLLFAKSPIFPCNIRSPFVVRAGPSDDISNRGLFVGYRDSRPAKVLQAWLRSFGVERGRRKPIVKKEQPKCSLLAAKRSVRNFNGVYVKPRPAITWRQL